MIGPSEAGSWKDSLLGERQTNTWTAVAVPFDSIPILPAETTGWLPVHTTGRGEFLFFLDIYSSLCIYIMFMLFPMYVHMYCVCLVP